MPVRRLVPLVIVVLSGVLAPMSPASGKPPKTLVDLQGPGTFELDEGVAVVTGEVTGKPVDGTYEATLAPVDGTRPDPGACEPATLTASLEGHKGRFLQLEVGDEDGEVCGEFLQPPLVVTHRFTGRYGILAGKPQRVVGTDGFVEVVLATEGRRAHFFAIDT